MDKESTLQPITNSDIPALVNIHMVTFNGFFLTFLGPSFLNQLYKGIIRDPSGIGIAAWTDGQISGFVVGSTQLPGLYNHFLFKHWWQFGWAALPALLRKPGVLIRLLRAFSLPRQKPFIEHCGTLMSIGVHPQYQGLGLGKQLVLAFLKEAGQRNLKAVNLTTDADANEYTNRFYQSRGFSLVRTYFTPEGRKMNEYLIYLHQ